MTIHYHGTPLTPRDMLYRMAGKNFCVSFAQPQDAETCIRIAQSIMWDNGAFTLHTRGKKIDWNAYYKWLEPRLSHPHWAVIPDVIGGGVSENEALVDQWPHRKSLGAPVWHMGVPVEVIGNYLDKGFEKICFGSSAAYWQVGSDAWCRRCDEAFNWLSRRGELPWIHMLRGMSVAGKRWPFASVDSVNVARNFKDISACPESMARTIDTVQCPIKWHVQPEQQDLLA